MRFLLVSISMLFVTIGVAYHERGTDSGALAAHPHPAAVVAEHGADSRKHVDA